MTAQASDRPVFRPGLSAPALDGVAVAITDRLRQAQVAAVFDNVPTVGTNTITARDTDTAGNVGTKTGSRRILPRRIRPAEEG